MNDIFGFIPDLNVAFIFSTLKALIFVIALIIFFNVLLTKIEKNLLQRVNTKRQISNIEIITKIFKYLFTLVIIISALLSFLGEWASLGIFVGLTTAALGFALQKPITGMAAWVMLVTKRPFEIGDRVVIGNVKGDVIDITLTHIHINEVGGTILGEDNSGRTLMIPNSVVFEQNIINYTLTHDYILGEVIVTVTYESDLDKAIEICYDSAQKQGRDVIALLKKDPYVRTFFQPSGIDVHVRYFAPARRYQEFASNITKEVFERIMDLDDVEIAYPHTEIILSDKDL
jgi:small-conductance mechanosensitive channel